MQISKNEHYLELYEWLEISGTKEEVDNAQISLSNVEGADLRRRTDNLLIVGPLKPYNPDDVFKRVRKALKNNF